VRRHDLIILKPGAIPQQVSCCSSDAAERYVAQWINEERPFVYPRQPKNMSGILLGLAFMEGETKHRAIVSVESDALSRVMPPYRLNDCLSAFQASDSMVLNELINTVVTANKTIRVFGSVSWEIASEKRYRNKLSDLDLLCDVETMTELNLVISAFNKAEENLSFKLDGEIRFPHDACVNWKELHAMQNEGFKGNVLVKDEAGVYLRSVTDMAEVICSSAESSGLS